jgi:hypothetical protein
VLLAFAGGIELGKAVWDRQASSIAVPPPAPAGGEGAPAVLAAGSELRTYELADARITLAPGSTVEVERGGTATRSVDLIQGEALFELHPGDAAVGALRIVAADAALTLEAGSAVRVLRRGGKLDVSVQKGGAALVAPTVEEHLRAGSRRLGVSIQAAPQPSVATAPPAKEGRSDRRPAWYLASDLDGGAALLPADDEQAVTSAGSAEELMALADLMVHAGRMRGASLAWEQVIERFERDQRAVIAAEKLAGAHPGRALDLALQLDNDALVCHVLPRDPDRARAARVARRYLAAHPASDCRDALAAILAPTSP